MKGIRYLTILALLTLALFLGWYMIDQSISEKEKQKIDPFQGNIKKFSRENLVPVESIKVQYKNESQIEPIKTDKTADNIGQILKDNAFESWSKEDKDALVIMMLTRSQRGDVSGVIASPKVKDVYQKIMATHGETEKNMTVDQILKTNDFDSWSKSDQNDLAIMMLTRSQHGDVSKVIASPKVKDVYQKIMATHRK